MNLLSIFLLAAHLVLFLAEGDEVTTGDAKRVVCYYEGPTSLNDPSLLPEDIDPTLCTHLIYMNAKVDNETDRLVPFNSSIALYEHGGEGYYNRTAKLKELNPRLKIMLHVNGYSYKSKIPTTSSISSLIESSVELLSSYGFDGLHFGWVQPEGEKWQLSLFMTELRKEFDKHGFLISTFILDHNSVLQDDQYINDIKSFCDFIILRTFDYDEDQSNVTHIISPLESIKSTVNTYLAKEIPADKMLISISPAWVPLKLKNINENGVGAETEPFINADNNTIDLFYYSKIMQNVKEGNWTAFRDENTSAPYATSNDGQWISYDDPTYVGMKAAYVVEKHLGGAAIFVLDEDDFGGLAGEGRFPLTRALNDVISRDNTI